MKIETDLQHVTVTLSPIETIPAFRHRLEIPLDKITSATAMDRGEVPIGSLFRKLGTHIPGIARYGAFGIGDHTQFWAAVRRPRLLVIDTQGWKYARVVLSPSDPDTVAATISAALR